jgi:hypothetical protein
LISSIPAAPIHYVSRFRRARIIARLKAPTHPGGYHTHVVFTDSNVYVENGERIDYFAPGELESAYSDGRLDRVRAAEALPERVQRARPDVAVDHPQGGEHQCGQVRWVGRAATGAWCRHLSEVLSEWSRDRRHGRPGSRAGGRDRASGA